MFCKDTCTSGSYFCCWPPGRGSWEQSVETRVGQISCKGQEWQPLRWKHRFTFLIHFSLTFCLFLKFELTCLASMASANVPYSQGQLWALTAYAWSTPYISAASFEFYCISLLIFGSILFFLFLFVFLCSVSAIFSFAF